MKSFKVEYDKLNSEQKEAVDHIEGPLLVIAGPGTGKTQLLSARVANILIKTDTSPNNIVCLTFTNKATDNMKSRLKNLIGNDATKVDIKTFHGFAAEIMNRYPEYFWRGAHLSIAPDVIQLEVMQQVLRMLPTDHILSLKYAGQYTLLNEVTDAIDLVKEAGLTPAKLRSIIKANIEYLDTVEPKIVELGSIKVGKNTIGKIRQLVDSLPAQPIESYISPLVSLHTVIKESFERADIEVDETGKTTPISQWKSRWLQKVDSQYGMHKERDRNAWWLGVADAYEKYRKQLRVRGYYDYGDMLVEVISQIEQNSNLRADLQEQFHYVLVDEFQDTNSAQLRLAQLIAEHQDIDNPNLMAVGDDDQSIFKFQGAELSNMISFTRSYKKAKLIVLTKNYRSTQQVLDCASKIIDHAQYRLINKLPELTKNLSAVNPPKKTGKIIHIEFPSREEQLSDLAKEANKLLKSDSVAILARKHESLRDIAMILHQIKAPISYEQSSNILEQPAIVEINRILHIITLIKKGEVSSVNQLFSQSLVHPMWGINTSTLWHFAIEQQTKYNWYTGLLNSKNAKLLAIAKWFELLVKISSTEPLAVVIEYVIGLRSNKVLDSPINNYFLNDQSISESYLETLSAIQLLRSLVTEFRSVKITNVNDYVDFINLMEKNKKIISDSSPFVSKKNSIELLTVHKAKGLEFDSVIIVDAVERQWSPKTRKRTPPANLPLRPPEDDSDDFVRLMYVASTRARHTILFGSYNVNSKGESVLPVSSLSKVNVVTPKPKKQSELITALEQNLRWPKLEQVDEYSILKPTLDNFRMNVSNLINFLDLTNGGPEYFKERNLLRLPQAKTPSSSMGSAVHSALEEAQHLANIKKSQFSKIIKTFEDSLLSEGLPEDDYQKRLDDGKRILDKFINKYQWQFTKGAHPEYKITHVELGGCKLGGNLDVIEYSAKDILITDYKTGRPLESFRRKSGDEGVKAWRHKLQLTFYAQLVQNDPNFNPNAKVIGQMVYVESNFKSKLSLTYQPSKEDVQRLEKLAQAVWSKIVKLDLPDVSKYTPDLKGITEFEEDLVQGTI